MQASFGLAIVLFGLTPVRLGPQDLASLLARQPGVTERWREHLIASPFGTIHAATFSFPRPLGTAIPEPIGYQLASLGPDVTGALSSPVFVEPRERDREQVQFPFIDRMRKGDRLVPPDPVPDAESAQSAEPARDDKPPAPGRFVLASASPTAQGMPAIDLQAPISISPPDTIVPGENARPAEAESGAHNDPIRSGPEAAEFDTAESDMSRPTLDDDVSPTLRTARIYFGVEPMGGMSGSLQPWEPGQQPIFDDAAPLGAPATATAPAAAARAKPEPMLAGRGGETIAGKGEVTGEGRHPKSPAERLGLSGKSRAKAEKCLADAVYYESRGEAVRGQIAVAQVVMNRVFSGYYPDNVCGVVYQNAHRHLACQFTFACDGIPERVTEADAWERAKRIARDTLDGKYWLSDVGKATHYHAYWVHPWWVRTMRKLDKIGVHTFYRPRKWGDGSGTPIWGDAAATREAARKL